jgi:hypothetical protein
MIKLFQSKFDRAVDDLCKKVAPGMKIMDPRISDSIAKSPKDFKDFIINAHNLDYVINDKVLDNLFGVNVEEIENKADFKGLQDKYPTEEFWQTGIRWVSYNIVRRALKILDLKELDVLCDPGSGYGRALIYAAFVTPAKCRGIEIVPERVRESMVIQKKFGLSNLDFIEGNVLDYDYSDGTVFFMYNPFALPTFKIVNAKLKEIAQSKKIKIVSVGKSKNIFDKEDWLRQISGGDKNDLWKLTIYESI